MDPYESPQSDPQEELESVAEVESPVPHVVSNQLRWWHGLFLLVSILAFAWFSPNVRAAIETRQFWPGLISDLVLAACSGAALGGVVFAVGQSFQRARTFPTRLGHWLLLMSAASWLAQACYSAIEWLFGSDTTMLAEGWQAISRQSPNLLAIRALLFLVASLVHWLALRKLRGDRLAQSLVMILLLGVYGFSFLPMLGESGVAWTLRFAPPWTLLVNVALLLTLVRDLRRPQGRDDLHWVGWITQVAVLIVGMIPVVYYLILLIRTIA